MHILGETPSRLTSLATLAGQPRDLEDPVTARYTEMLLAKLDPAGTEARRAVKKETIPYREAMARIGVLAS